MDMATAHTVSGTAFKRVWVCGMPRCGSMWSMNVARTLLDGVGYDVQPAHIPLSRDDAAAEAAKSYADPEPARVWVLKLHGQIQPAASGTRLIVPWRDPRDVLISYQRFVHCSFERALHAAVVSTGDLDYYRTLTGARTLFLPYAVVGTAEGVNRIGTFLDALPDDADAVVDRFRKDRIDGYARRGTVQVKNFDGSSRAYDVLTGFQSGHVSDYRDGDWQTLLTHDQKRQMGAALDPWLRANGLSP